MSLTIQAQVVGSARRILQFISLFFLVLPLRRETNTKYREDIGIAYLMLAGSILVSLEIGLPYIEPSDFPGLANTSITEGTLIRHPSQHGSRYTSPPIGLKTASGEVFFKQQNMGLSRFSENLSFKDIEGKQAKVWHWEGWVLQMEVEGKIPQEFSYERSREIYTRYSPSLFLPLIVLCYLLFRLTTRYGRFAWEEAAQPKSSP